MLFSDAIGVLEELAVNKNGCTITQIRNYNPHLDYAQTRRILDALARDGMVSFTCVPYRPGIEKRVYHIAERAASYCRDVSEAFEANHMTHVEANEVISQLGDLDTQTGDGVIGGDPGDFDFRNMRGY